MKNYITVDYGKALDFVQKSDLPQIEKEIKIAHETLHNNTGEGNEYLGWITLPDDYDKQEFSRIQQAALKIRQDSDILLVIGIGGSYLGAKAAIDMLNKHFDKNYKPMKLK